MSYTPNPQWVVQSMLESMGLSNVEELFSDIPDNLKLKRDLQLGEPLSELELRRHLSQLAAKNMDVETYPCFLGAGAYDHYIPAVVEQMLLRSEFYTAYTPYQAELSQGILQAIFEYQTMISDLTGLDVANASMYDGGSALAEACSMACDVTRHRKILIPDTVHPCYLQVTQTYALGDKMDIVTVPGQNGVVDAERLISLIDNQTAAVVIQDPNFYGILEPDIAAIAKAIHEHKGLLIMSVDPISLGLLKTPGAWGADVAVGEGQALGNPLSYGGPYLGFFAATRKLMRKMPGRLVGETVDLDGKRSFVLTLQAREQHIRREKASSNICSNEALCALAAAIYLTVVGKEGLRDVAARSHQVACYAKQQLEQAGLKLKFNQPFFKEFAVTVPDPQAANQALLTSGILGGYDLGDALLLAFTEKRTRAEVDQLVSALRDHALGKRQDKSGPRTDRQLTSVLGGIGRE